VTGQVKSEGVVTNRRLDAIVVGAGIAGLAGAWTLRDRDVLLLEADTRVGGRICSEPRGDYWLNWGAHVFAGPESATGRLMQDVGVHAEPVPGELAGLAMNGRLLTDGRVETYPFRVPMAWRDRAAVLRAGIKVRRAVTATAKSRRHALTMLLVTCSSVSTTSSGTRRSSNSPDGSPQMPTPYSDRP
jgi:protoporphyrinogen oxidase